MRYKRNSQLTNVFFGHFSFLLCTFFYSFSLLLPPLHCQMACSFSLPSSHFLHNNNNFSFKFVYSALNSVSGWMYILKSFWKPTADTADMCIHIVSNVLSILLPVYLCVWLTNSSIAFLCVLVGFFFFFFDVWNFCA